MNRPSSADDLWGYVEQNAPFDKVKQDIFDCVDYLKREGSSLFGLAGFCWGGKNSKVFFLLIVTHVSFSPV